MVFNQATASSYPPDLTRNEIDHLVTTVKDWTAANGLCVRPPPTLVKSEEDPYGVLAVSAPVTLFPSPFSRDCFLAAIRIQKSYNSLYVAISQDEEFLRTIAEDLVAVDDFISELWQIHQKVKAEGYSQKLSLGLFRSDYMIHQNSENDVPSIKQIEFNTIASSFGGLSLQTSELHRVSARRLTEISFLSRTVYPLFENPLIYEDIAYPANNSLHGLALGISSAFNAYIQQENTLHDPCVIFLVQEAERNIFDQRHLEYALQGHVPSIPVFRLPFNQILLLTSIASTEKRQLLYSHPSNSSKVFEVAVVYLRAGYGPQDYPDDDSWQGRLQIERSNAIKCPTVLTQLAGVKKVQQVLATPRNDSEGTPLSRFSSPTSPIRNLASTFTDIFPLDDSPAGQEARKIALDEELCKGYVLKPQREGGGNNFYRSAIPPYLKSIPESHWKSYILMKIITPLPVHNMILRNGVVEEGEVICELGVYGTCLWDQKTKEILHNEEAGYLLRTKGSKSEEGGVAAGFGAMDSCRLV